MRKILLTLLIVGLPGIACSQQPSDRTAQQQQEEQNPQAAQGEAAPQEQALQLAEGSLSKVDTQKQFIWIKTQGGKELQFSYNQETKVEGASETVEGLANTKMSGSDLKVHYRTEGGANIAVRIEVQGQKA